jgi:putative transposase
VFLSKCRRKTPYGELRRHLGPLFRKLTEQKGSRVEEGHLMPDHVHMLLSVPPKHAVAQVVGYIKGKSAIHIADVPRTEAELRRPAPLGAGVLRLDRREGRSRHP